MNPESPHLDPQFRAALAQAADIAASLGPPGAGMDEARRRAERGRIYWNEGGPVISEVREAVIPGPTRNVPVAVYRPVRTHRPLPVFVYLHGGGFRIGNQWANDRQMRELAQAWGGIVISSDYLHAPEHVFPAAVEEIAAVLLWLHEHGETWGIATDCIALGGSSAGASVAFGAAVHLGGPTWLQAGVGIVGAFTGRTDTPSMKEYGDTGLHPDAASVPGTFAGYVPVEAMRKDPRADVLLADPSCLPVAFLAAAECDVYRDASVLLAERLRGAGRLDSLKIYPRVGHLFFGFSRDVDRSAECVRDIAAFLARRAPV